MTRPPSHHVRSGAALLMVLAALVLVLAIAGPAVQVAGFAARDRRHAAASSLLDDLLREAARPIRHWLHEHSDRAVLPPDAAAPAVQLFDDSFASEATGRIRVRIVAFDQCGMVPWGTMDGALALALPDDLRSLPNQASPGLDLLIGTLDGPVFPEPEASAPPAAGALLATHNPPVRTPGSRPSINVNTAPRRVLDAALRSSGRGATEAIRQARADGRPFSAFARAGIQEGAGPRIVGASDCWAFRIDLQAGPVVRSWWEVHALRGSDWVRVQRLAITE